MKHVIRDYPPKLLNLCLIDLVQLADVLQLACPKEKVEITVNESCGLGWIDRLGRKLFGVKEVIFICSFPKLF
jgi:hypothetical protein